MYTKKASRSFLIIILLLTFTLGPLINQIGAQTPLLIDDLSNLNGWHIEDPSWYVDDGTIHGSAGTQDQALIWTGDTNWIDYQFTMNGRIVNSGDEISLVVRYQDQNNYYFVGLGMYNRAYTIGKYVNGVGMEIEDGVGSPSQIIPGRWYELSVVAFGSAIQLYVDGEFKMEVQDTSHPTGAVGFRTWDGTMQANQVFVQLRGWRATTGGPEDDIGYSMVYTDDGGYAMTGGTKSFGDGGEEVILVKFDSSGSYDWMKGYGLSGDENGAHVIQTSDYGYAIVGATNSQGEGEYDVLLIKTDSSGNKMWEETYGGPYWDIGYHVIQTSDEGYAIIGETISSIQGLTDAFLIKTDSDGKMQWNQTFGGVEEDNAYCLIQTNDEGYAIVGQTRSGDVEASDVWLIKTYSSGIEQWSKTYGGSGFDLGGYLIQTSDEGYAIGARTTSYGEGGIDVWLIKTDSSGNMMWSETYGGPLDEDTGCLVQTSDGGYVIAGSTKSYGAGDNDMLLVKTDSSGNWQWSQSYGGSGRDDGAHVVITSDGGLAIVGTTNSYNPSEGKDIFLVKMAADAPPYTVHDYDNLVHGSGLTIKLTATDDLTNVDNIYYRINGGSIRSVNSNGYPLITTEGLDNRLEYWSVDDLGHEEERKSVDNIKIDSTIVSYPPTGSITINNGVSSTNTQTVILNLEYSSNTYQVRFSNDGIWDTETWDPPTNTKPWTLTTGFGTKTVYYQLKNQEEELSQTYSDTIEFNDIIIISPTGSIRLSNSEDYTNLTSVTLKLIFSSDTYQVKYRNLGTNWGSWETPSSTKQWSLTTGDGEKTVQYQLKNQEDEESEIYEVKIELDTTPPFGKILVNNGEEVTDKAEVTLSLEHFDTGSGVDKVRYRNEGTNWVDWEEPADTRHWILLVENGTRTVHYQIRDNLGFVSEVFKDDIKLDITTDPFAIIIYVVLTAISVGGLILLFFMFKKK